MCRPLDPPQEAIEKFRDGRYVEAEEVFEGLWRRATGGDKDYYRGWVLLAAALFHRDRGNARGARSCFDRARSLWSQLPRARGEYDLLEVLGTVEAVLGTEWVAPRIDTGGSRGEERRREAWEEE